MIALILKINLSLHFSLRFIANFAELIMATLIRLVILDYTSSMVR